MESSSLSFYAARFTNHIAMNIFQVKYRASLISSRPRFSPISLSWSDHSRRGHSVRYSFFSKLCRAFHLSNLVPPSLCYFSMHGRPFTVAGIKSWDYLAEVGENSRVIQRCSEWLFKSDDPARETVASTR